MSWFEDWWLSTTLGCQIFASIGIAATMILLLQMIMLMFGLGEDDNDMSFDNDHDLGDNDHEIGLKLFTSRGIIAFFALFGWCGVACLEKGLNEIATIILAFLAGTAGLLGVAFTFFGFSRLQEDGTKDISTAIGKVGAVYTPIPPSRSGIGKVNVVVSGALGEYDAYTDDSSSLRTGQSVEVVNVTDNNVLVVMPSGRKEK